MKKEIWHKRFKKPLHPQMRTFTDSTVDDERLVAYDIMSCMAHVKMLAKCRLVRKREAQSLQQALKRILRDHRKGRFKMHCDHEDVHINIENTVKMIAGKTADKLHTARSRNDLIATDLRLYARDCTAELIKGLAALQRSLLMQAGKGVKTVIPGYTHLRPAQPITWAFYMQAQICRFDRDISCLKDAMKRVNKSPMGSAALAGTSHPIDPKLTARLLKFNGTAANALDAVSDRDFIAELLFICCQIAVHIAGLCEDIIIYSSPDYDLVELDDSISTGSSIMPQKKNPDIFEVLRAKAGNAIGNLTSVMCMLKGLPSSYNRDLQETKRVFFRQTDESIECLKVLKLGIDRIKAKKKDWIDQPNFICATALVDHLVHKGMAFRRAYDFVADCARRADGNIYVFITLCSKKAKIDDETVRNILIPRKQVHSVR